MSKSCSINCSPCGLLRAAVFGFILMALFAVLIDHYYAPTHSDINVEQADQRKAYREALDAEQATLATTYGWVDKDTGVVRLPIEHAKKLMVQSAKQP